MANITSIEINQFRGIKQLTVSDFSNINLIVGDNNSGKTTFLEAIQLLFAKAQLSSVKNIIRQRTVLNIHDNSFYTSFIKMFNVEQNEDLLDPSSPVSGCFVRHCGGSYIIRNFHAIYPVWF